MGFQSLCGLGPRSILVIDEEARGIGVRMAYSFAWGSPVSSLSSSVLDSVVAMVLERVRSSYTLESLKDDPVVRAYRDFYWRIGLDPTKIRPAGEALARRALHGSFPRINPVVDAGNLASLETLVSIGLYDVEKLVFPCRLVLSRGDELFKPIGGGVRLVEPGVPILTDSTGRVIHIYPHRDSAETAVTENTRAIWIVAALVPGVPVSLGVEAVWKTMEYLSILGWSTCRNISTTG